MTIAARDMRAPALEALRVNVIVERARARLSQEDLARRSGVARPTISRIERGVGDVGIEVVQRLADALGVTVAELFAPVGRSSVDDAELERRAGADDDAFLDARVFLDAVDEAAERPTQRYSRAGRPPVVR